MAELTDVRAGSLATRTIAVETEDPALVRAAVEELGLWSRPNVSFPRGLKALVGFGAHRYGVVDVGTNSVKFHLAERRRTAPGAAGRPRRGDPARRRDRGVGPAPAGADGANDRRDRRDGGRSTANGAEEIAAVGTAGLRRARNSAEFVDAVQARCGVASKSSAARRKPGSRSSPRRPGSSAATGRWSSSRPVAAARSSRSGHEDHVDEQFSVQVGAVRFTERFGLAGAVAGRLTAALGAIASDLARLDGRPVPDELVAIGGAVTNLAAVKHELVTYDPESSRAPCSI